MTPTLPYEPYITLTTRMMGSHMGSDIWGVTYQRIIMFIANTYTTKKQDKEEMTPTLPHIPMTPHDPYITLTSYDGFTCMTYQKAIIVFIKHTDIAKKQDKEGEH